MRFIVTIARWVFILMLHVCTLSAATLFVSPLSPNPTTPFSSWNTAATNIQDAVNAAPSGALILVTNGVYASGLG